MIESIQAAVSGVENDIGEEADDGEMEIDSIPFVSEKNVSTHLGPDKPVEEVLRLMIDRLRTSNKTVDTQTKP